MKKTFITLFALGGFAVADTNDLTYIVTFTKDADNIPSWSKNTASYDGASIGGSDARNVGTYDDGTEVIFQMIGGSGGKTWHYNATDTWENTVALNELCSTMGITVTKDDVNKLDLLSCGGAGSREKLVLTLGSTPISGTAVTLYTFVGQTNNCGDPDTITLEGLSNAKIYYATENGNGFTPDPSFSSGNQHMTLVKITGELDGTTNTISVDNNKLKAGYAMLAVKVAPEPATATLSLLALAALAARRRRK